MKKKSPKPPDDYAISKPGPGRVVPAPELAYRPLRPKRYSPAIGLVGCGGITHEHLRAYRQAGYRVVALTDLDRDRAIARRDEYYPAAQVLDTADDLLARPDIDIVDLATHPAERIELIRAATRLGKHVLSQKPFVLNLKVGRDLVRRARDRGVLLAVNQNGRWAPHVAYARQAIAAGLLGQVTSVDMAVHWDHNWVAGTPFDRMRHLLLLDFAVHWFDMLHCYLPDQRARRVVASIGRTPAQRARPSLLAQVQVDFPAAQATLVFRADTRHGAQDRTVIVGTAGTLVSAGPNINEQTVMLYTDAGVATPKLVGRWFPDGFDGTMSELICAIEDHREPYNSARDSLASLEMCFAALESADSKD